MTARCEYPRCERKAVYEIYWVPRNPNTGEDLAGAADCYYDACEEHLIPLSQEPRGVDGPPNEILDSGTNKVREDLVEKVRNAFYDRPKS